MFFVLMLLLLVILGIIIKIVKNNEEPEPVIETTKEKMQHKTYDLRPYKREGRFDAEDYRVELMLEI